MRSVDVMFGFCAVLYGCSAADDQVAEGQPGTCDDGQRNGAETDVDCGGSSCGPCTGGKVCNEAADCRSALCGGGICVPRLAITSISPPHGPTTGGIEVTVEGDEFKEGLVVTFDGIEAAIIGQNATEVTVTLPPRPGLAGKVDVAVINPDQETMAAADGFAYYYGRIELVEQPKMPASYKPYSIASGDFDKNGTRDLVVANDNGQSVSVFLGQGDGSFPLAAGAQSYPAYPVGNLSVCVVVDDLDGDGNEDLVVTNGQGFRDPSLPDVDGDVSVLLGRGDGTFSDEAIYHAGQGPSSVVVEDFDGDGIKDLAVTNVTGGDVAVLLGRGSGRFASYAERLSFPIGAAPHALALGDFNHDGLTDVVAANESAYSVGVLLGSEAGIFSREMPGSFITGPSPHFVAVADLDGDGHADVVTADRGEDPLMSPGSVTTLLGNGDGTFSDMGTSIQAGLDPRSVAAGDLNGDGVLDLVATNYMDDTVQMFFGAGDGSFPAQASFDVGGEMNGPCAVLIQDLNQDGKDDLGVANCAGNTVSVFLNTSE